MTATYGQIWYRKNGGVWNADAAANPASGVGGVSLAPIKGKKTFPTATVDGGGAMTFNFGASDFAYGVPSGFTPGWPLADGSGWTTLDPAKLAEDATLSDGNLSIGSDHFTNGYCQTADGYYRGSFYYEFTIHHPVIFFTTTGAGIGREYPGLDYLYWTGGEYDPTDLNGGSNVHSGFLIVDPNASVFAFGNTAIPNIFTFAGGDVISVAVTLVNNSKFEMKSLSANQTQPVAEDDDLVTMRYSDDGGKNWSDPKTQTLGAVGEYQKNISFRNIGMGRNKLIEVSWSSPRKVSLGGGTILADVAGS